MLGNQLLIGSVLIVFTALFHIACLVGLASLLPRIAVPDNFAASKRNSFLLLAVSLLGIIAIHTVEAWTWAAVYYFIGEVTEFGKALYFSVVTGTTLGYGDITLSDRWQLLASFEAMGGLILFGASTAFLIDVMRHLFDESR